MVPWGSLAVASRMKELVAAQSHANFSKFDQLSHLSADGSSGLGVILCLSPLRLVYHRLLTPDLMKSAGCAERGG